MSREEIFYLVPYVVSLFVILGVFLYAWKHRQVKGAELYLWFVGGQLLTVAGFILELISPNLETKLMWDRFQWLTDSFLVFIPFLNFSIQYTEHKLKRPYLTWGYWITLPVLFNLLLITDGFHHLIYPDPHLSTDYPFPELKYTFTTVVYAYSLLYIYGANFYGIGLLIRRAIQTKMPFRLQYVLVAFGFLIPLLFSFLALADIHIAPQRDFSPFSFAIGNLIVAWGIFRYGLFTIVPIPREKVIESMSDPVIVVDPKNHIVDINSAALQENGGKYQEMIGKPAGEVLKKWPDLIAFLENSGEGRKEISSNVKNDTFFYDISITPITKNTKELTGRLITIRDITRQKTLEVSYRFLSEELEQRIKERTEELRATAERYRAVVENQTEFIVRWKPDGTRLFVNDAYCRYFEITPKQALSEKFTPPIYEDDRHSVEEKTARLKSGAVKVETDVHRVIRPDGSIGWQEWTDQAIHNKNGEVIEIQSVGRDITSRKWAEESLRESESIYRKAIEVAGAVPYRQTYTGDGFHTAFDFISEGIREITGYGPDEFNEAIWDSLVQESHPLGELTQYSWRESIERVRSGLNPIWQCEYRIYTRSGETRWVYEAAVELRDRSGISHGSIGLFQDITERKLAEVALRKSEERFSKAFQTSPVMITIFQINDGVLLEVNDSFEKVSGYSRKEAIGKSAIELGLWKDVSDRNRIMAVLSSNGKIQNVEADFQIKSGQVLTCLCSAELIELDGKECGIAVIEDITDRKKSEERIRRLNRLYITISQINQVIVHENDRESLFKEICHVVVEHGKYRMAWIGMTNDADKKIRPVEFAGEEAGYLSSVRLDYHEEQFRMGTIGAAVREGHCVISQDISTDPRMIPWREQMLSRGYRSSAAVPIHEQGRTVGALVVYASESHAFDEEDKNLLDEIGLDISFALDTINSEIERKQAEEALLRESELNAKMASDLESAYDTTLEGWSLALDLRDKETEGHTRRVTEMAVRLARAMGLSEDELLQIRRGGLLHDIGKMGIPDSILLKPDKLTDEEWVIMRKHPVYAFEMLSRIEYLKPALDIPYCHHEKWNGTGYPRGLKGEEIPIAARIFAIVDVWDALSFDRPYRNAWKSEDVICHLKNEKDKHFDPKVTDTFLELLETSGV